MAKVRVEYFAHLRAAAGNADYEIVELEKDSNIGDFIRVLAQRHGEAFRNVVMNSQGALRKSILCFLNGQPSSSNDLLSADQQNQLTLMSPLGGG